MHLQERHSLFLNNFQIQFQRGREIMKTQSLAYNQMAQGVPAENGVYFSRFSDNEIEKI